MNTSYPVPESLGFNGFLAAVTDIVAAVMIYWVRPGAPAAAACQSGLFNSECLRLVKLPAEMTLIAAVLTVLFVLELLATRRRARRVAR